MLVYCTITKWPKAVLAMLIIILATLSSGDPTLSSGFQEHPQTCVHMHIHAQKYSKDVKKWVLRMKTRQENI